MRLNAVRWGLVAWLVAAAGAGGAAGAADDGLRLQANAVQTSKHTLTLAPSGLPEQIEIKADRSELSLEQRQNRAAPSKVELRAIGRGPQLRAPVRIEAVRGKVTLPKGRWTCHALAPDGSRKQQVSIGHENGLPVLGLSPEYESMWYLLERGTE